MALERKIKYSRSFSFISASTVSCFAARSDIFRWREGLLSAAEEIGGSGNGNGRAGEGGGVTAFGGVGGGGGGGAESSSESLSLLRDACRFNSALDPCRWSSIFEGDALDRSLLGLWLSARGGSLTPESVQLEKKINY